MKPSTRTLWAIEDWIRRTPLAVVRHLAAIVGPVAAGIWGTIDSSAEADVGVAIAAALVMLSFGCSLSHLRDPDHSIQKGLLAFLGAGALILVTKGVLLTFFAFAVISAGFFIRDVAVWCRRSKSGAGAGNRGGDELFEGNDSSIRRRSSTTLVVGLGLHLVSTALPRTMIEPVTFDSGRLRREVEV